MKIKQRLELPPKYSGKEGGHWREAEETEALIETLTNEAKSVMVDSLRKLFSA